MTPSPCHALDILPREGDFFPSFARLHSTIRFPWVSLLALTLLTAAFCYLPLYQVINAAVTVRILVQLVGVIGFKLWAIPGVFLSRLNLR